MSAKNEHKIIKEENIQSGKVKFDVLLIYFRACGYKIIGLLILFIILNNVTKVISNYWLSSWTTDSDHVKSKSSKSCSGSINSCERFIFYEINTPSCYHKYSQADKKQIESMFYKFLIFFIIACFDTLMKLGTNLVVRIISLRASKYLHDSMLHSILRSSMKFFESTPCGRIISRFSNDIGDTEWSVPDNFKNIMDCVFHIIFTIVLIGQATPW
jgi:ABC-type multidrug transport system fused ATPase/permease subunit